MNLDLLKKYEGSGILVCGHGSRNRMAVDEFAQFVESIRSRLPGIAVEHGYLEFARPILRDGLDKLRQKSVKKVLAVPAMLFAATHIKNDIPAVLNKYSIENQIKIEFGRELGVDRLMISAAGTRIQEVLDETQSIPLAETMLVVVGRGSSDPDANSNISKITRMLVEAFGFGWGETVFSGVTFPLVEPGLRYLSRLGFKRIIVFPYFLFSGVLVSRIKTQTKKVAKDFPDIQFLNASYLGNHPLVVETFLSRIEEAFNEEALMNCALCKYRDKLLGFENEVGLVQESHHHHVEGLEECCTLCETECTGACETGEGDLSHGHSHGHSSTLYPHADHPLGPKTL